MGEFIGSIFVALTILLWLDFILTFVSIGFNKSIIESLEERNELIYKRRNCIKKLFK